MVVTQSLVLFYVYGMYTFIIVILSSTLSFRIYFFKRLITCEINLFRTETDRQRYSLHVTIRSRNIFQTYMGDFNPSVFGRCLCKFHSYSLKNNENEPVNVSLTK